MIVGTGVDLAEVPRIRAAIERYGRRFIERIYTPAEIAYVERKANRYERFAARFAAKEAGMKAIGTGWRRGVRWQDFEVANLPSGKPTLRFHGQAARFAEALGVQVRVPIAHAYGGPGDGARDSGELGGTGLLACPKSCVLVEARICGREAARSCASSSRLVSCQV